MIIHIRHMVSQRCKMTVIQVLNKMGLTLFTVDLGVVILLDNITKMQISQIGLALQESGLELIEDKNEILIEQIKIAAIESIYYSSTRLNVPFSTYLKDKLNLNYNYLSNMFTRSEGYTIEHFLIALKIEHVKELIQYKELTFSEIAFKMQYSSIAHLSNQFKKNTGTTLSFYKTHAMKREVNIENL